MVITIDPRTGRLSLRDTGDLAAVGRGPRFAAISYKLNDNPEMLFDALNRLRIQVMVSFTVFCVFLLTGFLFGRLSRISLSKRHSTLVYRASAIAISQREVRALQISSFVIRIEDIIVEIDKLGPDVRGTLFIQLSSFPNHYLVLVIMDMEFRYALISVTVASDTMFANMVMEDIGWLDVTRIHGGEDVVVTSHTDHPDLIPGQKRKRDLNDDAGRNGSYRVK